MAMAIPQSSLSAVQRGRGGYNRKGRGGYNRKGRGGYN